MPVIRNFTAPCPTQVPTEHAFFDRPRARTQLEADPRFFLNDTSGERTMNPKARQDELITEEVGDELVVYDQRRKLAHSLNRTAALVWRHCDGQTSIAALAALLRSELDPVADEDLVLVAIDRLEAIHLLEGASGRTGEQARASRRQVVRKVGRIGVVSLLLPVITTLVAPTPAQAASAGQGCGSS